MQREVEKKAPRKKKLKAEVQDGFEQLTDEAGKELVKNSKAIAQGLAFKAKLGNASSTKYLLELAAKKKSTKKNLPSRAEELGKEEPWQPGEAETTEDSE